MREFVFPAWCRFGKCENGESEVTVQLDDANTELLVEYASDPDVYYGGFDNCLELSHLYDMIFELADQQITEELLEEGIIEKGQGASDIYQIGIEFPLEFEP